MEKLETEKGKQIHFAPGRKNGFPYVGKGNYNGEEKLIRWFHGKREDWTEKDRKGFYENLCLLLKEEAPAGNILWPLDAAQKTEEAFGYVTELYPSGYLPLCDYMEGRAYFQGWAMIVNAALSLTALFMELSRLGYHFCNLSDDDILIHSQTGKVFLAGAEYLTRGQAVRPPEFSTLLAPEYLTGKRTPDERTDEHLLAVLLFELFFRHHPLEGFQTARHPVITDQVRRECFGTAPVFVYDRTDESNRPVKGIHLNVLGLWRQYPTFIRKAFEETFDQDVFSGKRRGLSVKQWYRLMILLRSVIVPCSCGTDNFLPAYMESGKNRCIHCRTPLEDAVLYWRTDGKNSISYPVIPGGMIYRCQLDEEDWKEYSAEVGRFIRNKNTELCLIQNVTDIPWEVQGEDGQVGWGETIPVSEHLVILIGNSRVFIDKTKIAENEV